MRKRIFIASSVEGLEVAYAMQENMEHKFDVSVWSQGTFELSRTTIENVEQQLDKADAAIFVFTPDDSVTVRGTTKPAVRDNILFELGLFIGKLGRDRCFIVKPRSWQDFSPPSDLLGVTPGDYADNRDDANLRAALGPVCNRIKNQLLPAAPTMPAHATMEPAKPKLEQFLTTNTFRLFFNPRASVGYSKRMTFAPGGGITEGNNRNENSWRISNGKFEMVRLDGTVHSRFNFDDAKKRFDLTNEPDLRAIKNQYMVLDETKSEPAA